MVKKIAEMFNRLSRVQQRHRQQTDERPIAYSERNVVRSLKTILCVHLYILFRASVSYVLVLFGQLSVLVLAVLLEALF